MAVITIDGPASSGKGTVAKLVAKELGFHYLDSGSIYRALGFLIIKTNLNINDIDKILNLISDMDLSFINNHVILNGEDVTLLLRSEDVGMLASGIAKVPEVRARLLDFQRGFAKSPGLVTDGRDMGSVVFPNADLKVFLTASAEKRAQRRYSQLQEHTNSGTIEAILRDITARDRQDRERSVAPLTYDGTYRVLDNSNMSIDETVKTLINWYKEKLK